MKRTGVDVIQLFILLLLVAALGAAGWFFRENERLKNRYAGLRQQARDTEHQLQQAAQRQRLDDESRLGTEARLRRYLSILDTLINTIPQPIYFKDQEGIFRGCNLAFANEIVGLPRSAIIDRRGRELDAAAPEGLVRELEREELKLGTRKHPRTFETKVPCADGRTKDFLVSLAAIPTDAAHGSGWVGVLLDLTDRNRAVRERMEREKFEGVLETAGAVCHELNQPLQALTGYAELLQEYEAASPDIKRMIGTIQSQVQRLADITGKLQRITRYETQPYASGATIIDIHKASQSDPVIS